MMAGSHVALGAAAWLAAAPLLGQPALAPVPLGLAVLGSLLPDMDHPKSWAGRRVRPVSDALAATFGHRGVTHSLLAVVGCAWLLREQHLPPAYAAPLVVGYLSHLLADLFTPGGLRLLWPMRGIWSLPLCRTGSPFEPLVVALLLCTAWSSLDQAPTLRGLARQVMERMQLCGAGQGHLFCDEDLPLPPPRPPRPGRLAAREEGGAG